MTMDTPTLQLTRLDAAGARVAAAKAVFTVAAQSVLNGDPHAGHMAKSALAELDAARADLNRLQDAPVPQGMWAESARIMGHDAQQCRQKSSIKSRED